MPITAAKLLRYLVAILLGNGLYLSLSDYLPPAARQGTYKVGLGTVVDFWFCLMVFGLMELGAFLSGRARGDRSDDR